jgi:hypothetical protein
MKSFEDILDIPLDNPGDYTLVLQDSAGNTIAQTEFSPSFRSSSHSDPTLDASVFALRIPNVEGTEKIVLKHGDQVLAESTFGGDVGTTNNPPVAADDTAMTD